MLNAFQNRLLLQLLQFNAQSAGQLFYLRKHLLFFGGKQLPAENHAYIQLLQHTRTGKLRIIK